MISANSTLVESVPATFIKSQIFASSSPGASPTMFSGTGPGLKLPQDVAKMTVVRIAAAFR